MFFARLDPLAVGSDWYLTIQMQEAETGDPLDLTGIKFTVAVQKFREGKPDLVGSSEDGHISNPETGFIVIEFLGETTKKLSIGEYKVGLKAERSGFTETIILGTLPVIEGVTI